MGDNAKLWFKKVIRKSVNLNRLTAICGGDTILARMIAVRGLRELADDIESKKNLSRKFELCDPFNKNICKGRYQKGSSHEGTGEIGG